MKHNLYLGIHPAPYRTDLCNWLYDRLDCEIYHLDAQGADLAFESSSFRESVRYEYKTYPSVSFSRKGYAFLADLVEKHHPEIVFVSEFSATTLLMCLLKRLRKASFKVISLCDDSMDMIFGNDFSRRHALARRFVPRLVDNLVLDNPEVTQWYRKHFGKGVYFPIIADERRFRNGLERALPLAGKLADLHGLRGRKILLYVGRLIPLKQVDLLLRAYAPLKEEARLVLVGEGETMEELKALDASLGTDALFVGRKGGDELLAWYDIGDIHLLPSRVEAFGAVTGEALTAGLFTLVSDRAGSKALVNPGNGAVLPADRPEAWTEAIRSFLDRIPDDRGITLRESRMPILFEEAVETAFLAL